MTRSQIDELSQNLVFLINEMEDVLMKKIAVQLVSDGDISDSSKWRIRQLARAGKLDKEALKTIKSYMSAQSEMLEDALYNAALSEIGNVDEMVKDAATRGLVDGRVKAPADRTAQSALKSYLKQAKSDLNMVNTVMRYKTKQAYVSAVNNTFWTLDKEQRVHDALSMGALEVISGAESFQTAVRDVLKKLSEKGVPAFIDAGGHEWKPETYVQMDLRTTMGNTARAAQWQRCDDFGVDLIEVDSHLGAREKCARDQGKIYSRSGKNGTCKDGSGNVVYYYAFSSTSFGQPDGLFGINCRHNSYPYIPGVSYQRYFPIDEAENAKRYKEYQTQRALERKIRESKRECMLLSEAGDEEGLKKAALTLRNRKENYSAYSKAHDLRVHNDRTQVYGYDRSKSMKAVWAEKKANKVLDNGSEKVNNVFPIKNSNNISSKQQTDFKIKSELEQMSIVQLRQETANLAKTWYESGKSGISFGVKDIDGVVGKLVNNANRNSLIKDYMSLKKKVTALDIDEKNSIIEIGKSLGASAKNYPVKLPDSNQHVKLAEGQTIVGKAFAGKDTNVAIKDRFRLESKFNVPADEWKKVSGKGKIIENSKEVLVELHWYEADGKVYEMKVKRYLDEG